MSKKRSPRAFCSTTIGIIGLIIAAPELKLHSRAHPSGEPRCGGEARGAEGGSERAASGSSLLGSSTPLPRAGASPSADLGKPPAPDYFPREVFFFGFGLLDPPVLPAA